LLRNVVLWSGRLRRWIVLWCRRRRIVLLGGRRRIVLWGGRRRVVLGRWRRRRRIVLWGARGWRGVVLRSRRRRRGRRNVLWGGRWLREFFPGRLLTPLFYLLNDPLHAINNLVHLPEESLWKLHFVPGLDIIHTLVRICHLLLGLVHDRLGSRLEVVKEPLDIPAFERLLCLLKVLAAHSESLLGCLHFYSLLRGRPIDLHANDA
jgi:hypothetical protein